MQMDDIERAWRSGADPASGDGVVLDERSATTPVRRIVNSGSFRVIFRQSRQTRIVVAASDDEASRHVITRVEGDTLYLEPAEPPHGGVHVVGNGRTAGGTTTVVAIGRGSIAAGGDVIINGDRFTGGNAVVGYAHSAPVCVLVSQPTAPQGVEVNGSGLVVLNGVDLEQLALEISGSGVVVARGKATRVSIDISGSGSVDTLALQAKEASCDISGSGSVELRASERLVAEVAGSGSVTVRGPRPPVCQTQVTGSGDIWFENPAARSARPTGPGVW